MRTRLSNRYPLQALRRAGQKERDQGRKRASDDTTFDCVFAIFIAKVYKTPGAIFRIGTVERGRGWRRDNKKQQMAENHNNGPPDGIETAESAARYIAALVQELAGIARRNGLDTLSYILEMARLEADQIAKR